MANHRWAGNDHGYGWEFAMSKRINVQSTHGKFAKLRVSAETSAAAFGWELHKSDSALRAESTLVKAHLALAGSDELVRAEILDPNLDHTAEDMPSSSHKMRKPVQKKVGWQRASPRILLQRGLVKQSREQTTRAHRLVANRTATEYLELASPRKWTCWRWRSIRTWRLKPGKCLRGADCLFCHAAHRSRGRTIGQKQYSRFQPQPRALLVTCRGLRFQTTFS